MVGGQRGLNALQNGLNWCIYPRYCTGGFARHTSYMRLDRYSRVRFARVQHTSKRGLGGQREGCAGRLGGWGWVELCIHVCFGCVFVGHTHLPVALRGYSTSFLVYLTLFFTHSAFLIPRGGSENRGEFHNDGFSPGSRGS